MKFLARLLLSAFVAPLMSSLLHAQDGPVDWKILASEFLQNADAASAKYQGKLISVTGPVASIASGDMTLDDPSVAVTISSPEGPGPDVKCLFQTEDLPLGTEIYVPGDGNEAILRKRNAAGEETSSQPLIDQGQHIVVTGAFFGFAAGDIVLQHCRLDKKQAE